VKGRWFDRDTVIWKGKRHNVYTVRWWNVQAALDDNAQDRIWRQVGRGITGDPSEGITGDPITPSWLTPSKSLTQRVSKSASRLKVVAQGEPQIATLPLPPQVRVVEPDWPFDIDHHLDEIPF
jgi:hypothetical protein